MGGGKSGAESLLVADQRKKTDGPFPEFEAVRRWTLRETALGLLVMVLSLWPLYASTQSVIALFFGLLGGAGIVVFAALTCQCPSCGSTLGIYVSPWLLATMGACPFCRAVLG